MDPSGEQALITQTRTFAKPSRFAPQAGVKPDAFWRHCQGEVSRVAPVFGVNKLFFFFLSLSLSLCHRFIICWIHLLVTHGTVRRRKLFLVRFIKHEIQFPTTDEIGSRLRTRHRTSRYQGVNRQQLRHPSVDWFGVLHLYHSLWPYDLYSHWIITCWNTAAVLCLVCLSIHCQATSMTLSAMKKCSPIRRIGQLLTLAAARVLTPVHSPMLMALSRGNWSHSISFLPFFAGNFFIDKELKEWERSSWLLYIVRYINSFWLDVDVILGLTASGDGDTPTYTFPGADEKLAHPERGNWLYTAKLKKISLSLYIYIY